MPKGNPTTARAVFHVVPFNRKAAITLAVDGDSTTVLHKGLRITYATARPPRWLVRRVDSDYVTAHRGKLAAIYSGRRECVAIRDAGGLAMLRIANRDGRLSLEWTYGADPRASKG